MRYEPKTFKQCRLVDGQRVWNMEGVERLPYRLPELLASPASVWIVEGEKDVETLRAIGQVATCNPGGAGKWLPAFSEYLKGKHVYIAADNDELGQKHGREVLKSLEGIVEWVKWIELPKEHNGRLVKDITDLRSHCQGEDFLDLLADLQVKARLIDKGVDIEAYTMAELEQQYITEVESFSEVSLSLGNWLPGLNIRPLIPGDVLGIIAGTGQLKSAAAQNILACNPRLRRALLSAGDFGSSHVRARCGNRDRHRHHRGSSPLPEGRSGRLALGRKDEQPSGLDPQHEHEADRRACLSFIGQTGKRASRRSDRLHPTHQKGNRYERVSEACEETKRLAKKWNLIAVILSQIARKNRNEANTEEEIREVSLYDGKESGSLENSCSVLLGMWKTSTTEMKCRVLKNTKGLAGNTVAMKIRDGTFIIEPA